MPSMDQLRPSWWLTAPDLRGVLARLPGCWPMCRAPAWVPCAAGRSLAGDATPPTWSSCTRLQLALLASAIDSAAPGGVIGYLTCSPHRRETSDVVSETLAVRADVEVIPAAQLLPEVPNADLGPYLQLWPHRHGTDAMFAAYLRKSRCPVPDTRVEPWP